jgi:CheY-like chemotaxis protein
MQPIALVVDDSMLIRHTVCRLLQEYGFAVESVGNGQEALERLKEVKPSLIVTDMQMPKMGGSELITALKQNSQTAHVPIIIVAGRQSGFQHTEHRADFVIFKDIEIESQMKKAISAIFRKAKSAKSNQ